MLLFVSLLSVFFADAWGDEVCCVIGGCFSNAWPYEQLPLPKCPETINPVFWLYTRNNRLSYQSMTMTSIPSNFDGSLMTEFIVHGYQSDQNSEWMHTMKDALLDKADMNVVIVGWGNGANEAYYPQAASNTRTVAAELALVIDNLKNNGGSTSARIYCNGHSLGAHLCGHTGKNTAMGRITGMDPAGPMYQGYPIEASLNPTCASFVDVIHTNGQGGLVMNYGSMRALGDMDFYPNAADVQPGCATRIGESFGLAGHLSPRFPSTMDEDPLVACSHSRAHVYYTESVKSNCFIARESCTDENNIPGSCSSCGGQCGIMGYGAQGSGSNGLYYLTTSATLPYCQN